MEKVALFEKKSLTTTSYKYKVWGYIRAPNTLILSLGTILT
jgi:hypothetical protein